MTALPRRGPVAAIVFDLDGVLVDSEPLWRDAEIEVFGSLGVRLTAAACRETMGLRVDEVVAHWRRLGDWGAPRDETVVASILDAMARAITTRGAPVRGAIDCVTGLAAAFPLAVASSSPPALIDTALARLGLESHFAVRCSGFDEVAGKPHPAVYLRAAEALGVDARRCVAVEDSPNGIRAALAAGSWCVALRSPDADDDALAHADRIVDRLSVIDTAYVRALTRPAPSDG